jgi:hypothetical protein
VRLPPRFSEAELVLDVVQNWFEELKRFVPRR